MFRHTPGSILAEIISEVYPGMVVIAGVIAVRNRSASTTSRFVSMSMKLVFNNSSVERDTNQLAEVFILVRPCYKANTYLRI